MMPKEIERKFLVKKLPEIFTNVKRIPAYIKQGYLPDDGEYEVRLRKEGNIYTRTKKIGSGMVRNEEIENISRLEFEADWPFTEGRRLEKIRLYIEAMEIDIYQGNLYGLVVAEIEFSSEEEAGKFIPPDWFGKEITNDERYKNKNLARYGIPKKEV